MNRISALAQSVQGCVTGGANQHDGRIQLAAGNHWLFMCQHIADHSTAGRREHAHEVCDHGGVDAQGDVTADHREGGQTQRVTPGHPFPPRYGTRNDENRDQGNGDAEHQLEPLLRPPDRASQQQISQSDAADAINTNPVVSIRLRPAKSAKTASPKYINAKMFVLNSSIAASMTLWC
jgi:hypothetical protein